MNEVEKELDKLLFDIGAVEYRAFIADFIHQHYVPREEVEKLITKEITIAQKGGKPTSGLTALWVKIKSL